MELHSPESSFDRHNNVTKCNEGMKEQKAFGCASATSGSFARGKRSGRRLYDLRRAFAVIVGACILNSLPCAAQIEVNAYISNSGSNSVSVVDTKANTVVGSPILVGSQPAGVAVTPDGRYAYVTNNGGDAISVIDTATNTVLASPIPLESPAGIAVTPDSKYAYVTNSNLQGFIGNSVSVINTATNTVLGSPIVVGNGALGVAVTPDGKYAYVANDHDDTVSVINTATNTVVGLPIPVGSEPVGVAVTPNGQYVFVTNNHDFTVSVINTATQSVVGPPIGVGNDPAGVVITPDGRFAYVANNGSGAFNSNTVSVIEVATNAVVGLVTVGNKPLGIAVTPDGKYVYVANSDDGTVSVISTATNTVVGSPIVVESFPIALGFFVGPNIIVAKGGPLVIANDAALTPLGFGQFVNFNAGTLKITGDFVSWRTISLLAQGGTIDTNGFNASLSGDIINPGSLTKIGIGTLTLSGNNTYSGGTNLNGGILAVKSDVNLGVGPLSFDGGTLEALGAGRGITSFKAVNLFAGGGTFLADAGTASTLGGSITGVGAWTKTGPGTLALSGTNTYSGGTTIAQGMLLTQSASALGTGPVTFGNGTTLQVQNLLNANGNWTVFPGTTTVNGGTVKTFSDFKLGGGGTLIANANFNVPGEANVNRSVLVVNNQFTIGGDIDLNRSEAIINGVLTSPIVNVKNVSSLIVNNPGTVAAKVNVGQSAQLALFGKINGSVTNAGFFQGTGVVNGNVINSGTLAPGAPVGQLTINGNYTQNASGTLRIEVAGSSPGQFDLLPVNGQASLAGRLQLVRVGGFNLSVGDQITFLTASNGVSETFENVENDFLATGSIVVFDVVYLPNGVVLEGKQGSFAEFAGAFAGTPNAVAVGNALDSAVGDPRASGLIEFLDKQTLNDLFNDFDLISPEELTSIYILGVSLANVQSANLERRMDDIRTGSCGFSSAGFAINGSGPSFAKDCASVSPDGKSSPPVFAPISQDRWGVFVTGIGEFTNLESTFNASGYELATGGFTMGIDYRIGSNFAIGLTGGYAYTDANLVNDGSIQVNGGKLGLYATAFARGFYLDTAVIGGLNGYDTRRTGLMGTASGRTEGGYLNVLVAGGYDWKKGGLSIGPTASFQYTYVGLDDFTESGSLAPLAFPNQHAESFRTAFGMKASYDWKIGPIHLIPEFRAAWQHEFGDTDYSLVSSSANGVGNSFTVNGPEIGRDSLLLSTGFAVQWNERISTYAYYDGELFRTNYLSNNISAGVRITF